MLVGLFVELMFDNWDDKLNLFKGVFVVFFVELVYDMLNLSVMGFVKGIVLSYVVFDDVKCFILVGKLFGGLILVLLV